MVCLLLDLFQGRIGIPCERRHMDSYRRVHHVHHAARLDERNGARRGGRLFKGRYREVLPRDVDGQRICRLPLHVGIVDGNQGRSVFGPIGSPNLRVPGLLHSEFVMATDTNESLRSVFAPLHVVLSRLASRNPILLGLAILVESDLRAFAQLHNGHDARIHSPLCGRGDGAVRTLLLPNVVLVWAGSAGRDAPGMGSNVG